MRREEVDALNGLVSTRRAKWIVPLACAILLATSRSFLIGAREVYGAVDLHKLAIGLAARRFFAVLLPCAAFALALGWALWASRGRAMLRGVLAAVAAAAAWLFLSGRLPPTEILPAGRTGLEAAMLRAGPYVGGVAVAALLAFAHRKRALVVGLGATAFVALSAAGVGLLLSRSGVAKRGQAARADARPNVLLISLDTVRADHLRCYGYREPTSPEIDRFFANDSARFTAAFAPQPWTLTSHMTMLTSLHPTVHGVTAERGLPEEARTLAGILSGEGYAAFAFVHDMPWMARRYGFARGFHVYRRFEGDARSRQPTVDRLLDDLASVPSQPFFLFLHYFDAHSDRGGLPYDSDPEDRQAFTGWYRGDFAGHNEQGHDGTGFLWWLNKEDRDLDLELRRYLVGLYDAGLRTLDRAMGCLFRSLEERGLLENTIVVLTADHGEEFEEHGRVLHSQAYDECTRVPLMFRVPRAGATRESRQLVGLLDVAPTILELCRIEPSSSMQGRSLCASILGDSDAAERTHVLLLDEDGRAAVRTPGWKLVTGRSGIELYDLASDPGETKDLFHEIPPLPAAEGLRRLLEQERRESFLLRRELGIEDAAGVVLTEEERRELQSLGYLGGS